MKTRTILSLAAVAAMVAVPAVVVAQNAFGGHGPALHGGGFDGGGFHMIRGFLGRLGDKIGLDDDQRAAIETIAEEEGPAIRALIDQARTSRQQFAAEHDPGSFDEAAFRAHAEEQARLEVEIKVATARALAQVWSILTEEQKQELRELRELAGRRGGFGPHRGGWGGDGGPPDAS